MAMAGQDELWRRLLQMKATSVFRTEFVYPIGPVLSTYICEFKES